MPIPDPASLQALAARAESALAMATCYWLGTGNWRPPPAPDCPGTTFDAVKTLKALRDKPNRSLEETARLRRYEEGLARGDIDPAKLPNVAADCSGFVHWALRQDREGWNTTRIHRDAMSAAPQRFVRVDEPQPGVIVVYPDGHGEAFGHIGILVHDAQGALRVIHCDASNYLLTPPPGLPRNAIARTDLAKFDERPDRIFVVWKPFMR